MFALANMFHFFAHELASLSAGRFAFPLVFARAFNCFFFWHNKWVSPLTTFSDVKKYARHSLLPDLQSCGSRSAAVHICQSSPSGIRSTSRHSIAETKRTTVWSRSPQNHTLRGELKSLQRLDSKLLGEIEHFFVSYNDARGKKFKAIARKGPALAKRLIKKQTKKRK